MKRKIVTLLLAIAIVVMMLPMTMVSVFAEEGSTPEKNITLGATALQGEQKSNVYYGTYKQSSDNNGGYNVDPIKWRVLSNGNGKLFLLADQNLDVFQYNTAFVDVTWKTSTMRSWLNGYEASKNGQNTDYTTDNFIKTAFSTQELAYILKTTLENADNPTYDTEGGDNTEDYVFLLSIAEATNTAYGFTDNMSSTDTRVSTNTAYVAAGGKLGTSGMYGVGEADYWWLRSPGYLSTYAAYVYNDGLVDVGGRHVRINYNAVRPAFNLNLSSVLFTSAAKGGKSSISANAEIGTLTDNDGYKLTLLDASRNGFAAEILKTANRTFVKYQGATTGTNEYITAMVVNASGEVTYYGSLKNITQSTDASGIVDIDLSGMNSGDKVYILNEQWNGDYKTDYASALNEVTVPTDVNAYNVSFNANGGTGTMSDVAVKLGEGDYTLPECTFTYEGYAFAGWSYTAGGEVIKENAITLTQDITLYAVWLSRSEKIEDLEEAITNLENAKTELNNALATKADTETVNAAIKNLQDAIDALEAVKDDYVAADTALKTELEGKINTAKSEAITAATTLVENAKKDLNEAIAKKADAATVNAAIKNLQDAIDALEAVKDDYVAADTALKAELEAEIDALKARIAELENRNPMFKVENGKLYVRYDETEDWACIGTVQGENGADGTNGTDGKDGVDGENGKDGITPQIRINSETNEWEVSYDNGVTWTSLGVKATGDKGEQGIQGEKGEKGDTGAAGADGKDGADGLSIAATVIGSTALVSNIALIAYALIKKKRLF